MQANFQKIAGSFRDPSGFMFHRDNVLYRQVNVVYRENYDLLLSCGLYENLVDSHLVVEHREVEISLACSAQAYKIIQPQPIDFVSYPYEWCFSQLKDAALATLAIQKRSLAHDMSLRDAGAFNIQFSFGKPVLIDTLSFEKYEQGKPWGAYRQFCQHFLAPLALAALRDVRLLKLLQSYLDGIPLDLASNLLPRRTYLNLGLATHIHAHAKSQQRYADKSRVTKKGKIDKQALLGIIDNLESTIQRLHWAKGKSAWSEYYAEAAHLQKSLKSKEQLVKELLQQAKPSFVWDLGANTGLFSRLASGQKIPTVAFDLDYASVEANYRLSHEANDQYLLPLVVDLTNPSPVLGWAESERMSLLARGPADTVLALALLHHLAIANNVPLDMLADFFDRVTQRNLIVEFIPKEDEMVQKLLATREDIFDTYEQTTFEAAFGRHFHISSKHKVGESKRVLYLMTKR